MMAAILMCERCQLTTEDGIQIASNGMCDLCNDFEQKKQEGYVFKDYKGNESESRKSLLTRIQDIKNRENQGKYDCLLHLSGGKDSVMALYELKNIYDMRILAYMHDNGFESEEAKNNVKNATDILSVDLIYLKQEVAYKPFYHFFRSGLYKKVDVCAFCEFFQEPFHSFAHQLMDIFGIPVEITGSAANADIQQPLLNNNYELVQDFLNKNNEVLELKNNELLCQRVDMTIKRYKINYWAEVPQDMALTIKTVTELLNWKPKHSDSSDTGCNLCYIQMLLDNKYSSASKRTAYKYIKAHDIRMGHATPEFYVKNSSKLTEQEQEDIIRKTNKVLELFDLNADDL
jgi:hypothetical protein